MTALIALEGCIGVGKTTIAKGISTYRRSRLLLEDFSSVPFLEAFYADPIGCALETEFSFLLQHYHQLKIAAQGTGEIVADFSLEKDLIFANLNMHDATERSVFGDLYQVLATRVQPPRLTVFLTASDDLVLKRIQERGRPFELAAPAEYYKGLNAAYEEFFALHQGPIIRISSDKMDFCKDPELYQWLSAEIEARLVQVATESDD